MPGTRASARALPRPGRQRPICPSAATAQDTAVQDNAAGIPLPVDTEQPACPECGAAIAPMAFEGFEEFNLFNCPACSRRSFCSAEYDDSQLPS
ncbi:hypothetical protein [Streptomyces sp. NPDC001315]|uniref:hypothetical protein n=1 Tax=Streptomyces sp. NPDC001315 TaxID=3364562 RepID=UPI0036C95E3F